MQEFSWLAAVKHQPTNMEVESGLSFGGKESSKGQVKKLSSFFPKDVVRCGNVSVF